MQEKPDQRSYVLKVLERTGWNQTELAKRAGLHPSTLSRFFTAPPGAQALRASSISRIAQVSGIPMSAGDEPSAHEASGMAESEAQPLANGITALADTILAALRTEAGAVDAWRLNSRALELAGYRPGDVLFVKLGAPPLKGDVVCAQVYDWVNNRTETVFRLFEPPYLITATADISRLKPLALDDENVAVKGTVLHALRSR